MSAVSSVTDTASAMISSSGSAAVVPSSTATSVISQIISTTVSSAIAAATTTSAPTPGTAANTSVPLNSGPFSVTELGTLQMVLRVSATLSFIGALSIILTYMNQQRFRTAANKLIFYTSFGELLLSFVSLVGDATVRGSMASPALCTIQGFMVQFSISATMWWSFCMALHGLLVVIYKKPVRTLENFFIFYCIISWGLPLVSSFLILSLGNEMQMGPSFGDNFIYCWIASPYKNWRLYSYYIPLWIIFFGNIAMYYAVVQELKKMKAAAQALRQQADISISSYTKKDPKTGKILNPSTTNQKAIQAEKLEKGVSMFVLRTFIYVAMFAVNWFVPSINRVQGIIAPAYPNFVLFIFHAFSVPCGGFLNAIVYFVFAAMADPKNNEEKDMEATINSSDDDDEEDYVDIDDPKSFQLQQSSAIDNDKRLSVPSSVTTFVQQPQQQTYPMQPIIKSPNPAASFAVVQQPNLQYASQPTTTGGGANGVNRSLSGGSSLTSAAGYYQRHHQQQDQQQQQQVYRPNSAGSTGSNGGGDGGNGTRMIQRAGVANQQYPNIVQQSNPRGY